MSWRKDWLKTIIGAIGVLLVGFAVFNYCRVYCRAPIHLTLSGGNVCPSRSEMAQAICSEVHDAGIELEAIEGTNPEAVCSAVDNGELDLGLVLGGFPTGAHANVRQVATFGVEPLHLLVRGELLQGRQASLELLRGRVVSLGEPKTNGAILAESLMRFAGFKPSTGSSTGDYKPVYLRNRDLHVALTALANASPESRAAFAAILPDAVFAVDNVPGPLVDRLVTIGGYRLVPLPYATALHLDARRNHGKNEDQLENSRLEATKIPACAYGINPAVPAADCETFGLRLMLVTNKNVSSIAILRLLRALDNGVVDKYRIELNVANQYEEFPIHPGAVAFAKGRKPLILGELLEPVQNVLSVAGAGGAGVLAVWGFFRGLRAVQPDVHLREINRIERLLRGDEQDASAPALPGEFMDYLEQRLAAVKQAAIDDYAAGRLHGDEAFMSILTLVADTRQLLAQKRKQLSSRDACPPNMAARLADAA